MSSKMINPQSNSPPCPMLHGNTTPRQKRKKSSRLNCLSQSAYVGMYRKVLLTSLHENCQAYPWFQIVLSFVQNSNWDQLYSWTEHGQNSCIMSAAEHFAVAQISALVKKAPFHWSTLKLPMSPEDQAKQTFLASEEACRAVNAKLRLRDLGSYSFKIDYMRRWIAHVLGKSPNLLEIYDNADFSSGACIGVHGNATNLYRKLFATSWTVTPTALPYARSFFKRNPMLSEHLLDARGPYVCYDNELVGMNVTKRAKLVTCNKLSFVPKTVKTHRVIAVEPLLNSVLQKGVDSVMRKKLRHVGYDLRNQGLNQELAKIGSLTGELATMDLKSASDSISIELARLLLPPEWFDLLNRLRSPSYELDGAKHRYEKFCSMGNGFCFPLETLIFAAATRAVMHEFPNGDRRHAVYGDDIIAPTPAFNGIADLLLYLGFTTNETKSFNTGPFRESCGADWYMGQDVRPVYLDYPLATDVAIRIFHNATLRGTRTTMWFDTIRPFLRKAVPASKCFLRPADRRRTESMAKQWLAFDEKFVVIANLNGAFDVELDTFMGSQWSRWNREEQRWGWKEFLYTSLPDEAADQWFNRAQYLAFLRGSPEGKLALRRKTRVSTVNK